MQEKLLCEFKLKGEEGAEGDCVFVWDRTKHPNMREWNTYCVQGFLTIFVAGDRNVVDSAQFETGTGQDLKLHRT